MNIKFSNLGKYGRLANQLFQVASTIGLADLHGREAIFPEWEYEKYFDIELNHSKFAPAKKVNEEHYHHHEWKLPEQDVDIYGYLQSERYFSNWETKHHKSILKFKDEFIAEVLAKHHHLNLFSKPTIAIHIRRGDYVNNPNYYHLTPNWYIHALLTHFKWQDYNILFFSDDIEYCKVHFECLPNAYFIQGNSDVEDMALASQCNHFILSNSSYSWWIAYLGEDPYSKIIHPGFLFAGKLLDGNNAKDYWPERWTRHQVEGDQLKLDLTDVTFTIPVYGDHEDRSRNFSLSTFMIMNSFHTNIITMEQGGSVFGGAAHFGKYMEFKSSVFHRTKMLNEMAIAAETPIIVNWDCDVIIPPMQLWLAIEEIRNGADMVFPYDGKFARMPRDPWFKEIEKSFDIGIVRNEQFKGREEGHNSVGGAVIFNKEAFIQGGMENEHMISFGPEDCERHDRFKLLGYEVKRVAGSLFHVDHHVGINSSTRNPYFSANHKEIDKIRAMSKDELHSYVDTWAWRHPYTQKYYYSISEGSIRSAKIVMKSLYFTPETVIDVGCGVGEWNNENESYYGIDFGIPLDMLLIPRDRYMEIDLNKATFDVPNGTYGLCICLEVAEHLKPSSAKALISMLCRMSDRVLFSAAIPGQGGTGHINEQWQSYWANLFNLNGFGASQIQPNIRDNSDVELWYRQNIILYERGATGKVIDFVLPEYYIEIVKGIKNAR